MFGGGFMKLILLGFFLVDFFFNYYYYFSIDVPVFQNKILSSSPNSHFLGGFMIAQPPHTHTAGSGAASLGTQRLTLHTQPSICSFFSLLFLIAGDRSQPITQPP